MNTVKFVKTYVWAYRNNKTAEDVATKLGMDRNKVYIKANGLRARGVNLPRLARSYNSRASVEYLNQLIAEAV